MTKQEVHRFDEAGGVRCGGYEAVLRSWRSVHTPFAFHEKEIASRLAKANARVRDDDKKWVLEIPIRYSRYRGLS